MLEQLLSRENLLEALKRVEANKGSHGVDGMSVKSLREHIKQNWLTIRQAIEEGTFQPNPVRRVEIPKPNGGGVRMLGIPTVLDRMLQQAIAQVLTPLFDPQFSEHSYGFRPRRRGHDAVRKAREFMKEGYRFVVDLDLEKFFDRVNHDRLMMKISEKVKDKKVLLLIRKYLQSVMENGLVKPTNEGTPQGGPLSPLLSNVVLDELDKELEKRGHRFVRYADDCNIYVKTKRAGERVKASVTHFIETRLKLKVNQAKSAVDRPWKRKFLGFSFSANKEPKVRIAKQSLQKADAKIREITSRRKSMKMEERIKELNQYLIGWCGYFSLADTPSIFQNMDSWIRRRLRMCLWKQWKNPRTKVKRLISLGMPKDKAYEWGNTRKGYWRIAGSPILSRALNNHYWETNGLKSLTDRYNALRNIS
jgi:RNA-directed DNA polymerase